MRCALEINDNKSFEPRRRTIRISMNSIVYNIQLGYGNKDRIQSNWKCNSGKLQLLIAGTY